MVHEVVRHHMILHNNTYARMVIVRMVTARTTHSGAAAAATLLCPGGGRERERAQRAGAYHVVQYRSQQNPKGGHSIKTWCGWAGRWPEGHDVTPKPSRKKKEERERENHSSHRAVCVVSCGPPCQPLHNPMGGCASLWPEGR